jgi:hypothetical protein
VAELSGGKPASLNGDPGELAEWPGVASRPVEGFAVPWQDAPGGPAYAGAAAAPAMTMPAKQPVAKSVRIMTTFRSGRAPSRTLCLEYGSDGLRVRNTIRNICCARPHAAHACGGRGSPRAGRSPSAASAAATRYTRHLTRHKGRGLSSAGCWPVPDEEIDERRARYDQQMKSAILTGDGHLIRHPAWVAAALHVLQLRPPASDADQGQRRQEDNPGDGCRRH